MQADAFSCRQTHTFFTHTLCHSPGCVSVLQDRAATSLCVSSSSSSSSVSAPRDISSQSRRHTGMSALEGGRGGESGWLNECA